MESKALWHLSNQKTDILQTTLAPGQGPTVDIKTLYSLVSLGTERLVASGNVPSELFQEMEVPYMEGSFGFPIKYGYSLVGQIVNSTSEVNGRFVHMLHPHQDFCRVSPNAFSVLPLGIPPLRATLVSNLETALNAVWDAQVNIGDRVAVVGFGAIGALLCRLLKKLPEVELSVFELDPNRRKLVEQWGFKLEEATSTQQLFDVTFNCSGAGEGLQFCLDHTGMEGKVVELSWYGLRSVSLQLGKYFHSKRLKLISAQVSQIPPDRKARWDFDRRKQTVFRLLRDPDFDLHITHTIPFEQAPGVFSAMRKGQVDGIGYCLTY